MKDKQDWIGSYKELGAAILDPKTGIKAVKHVDLWHEQVDYLPEEYPWPSDSVFLEYNIDTIETTGLKVQDLMTEISVYYCLDTLADSYVNSPTMDIALEFGKRLREVHKFLQGKSGVHFGKLDRVGIRRVPAPQYLLVYKQVYRCVIRDESAMDELEDRLIKKSKVIKRESPPEGGSDQPLYTVNL
jgi:hypothetical protein